MSDSPVLSVRELTVSLRQGHGFTTVVDAVSFDLRAREVLALVGQSGCGKTKTAEALMGLLPSGLARVHARQLLLEGMDLAKLPETALRRVRGRDLSMVFQEPLTALDPVFRAGHQLTSVLQRHRGLNRRQASEAGAEMLSRVGFSDPGTVMRSYPHELSGGMRQRVLIAMAMACQPRVLIADEPTTALDVTTQAEVLAQLVELAAAVGTAILLITHDLGIVAQYCDRALVMQDGRIVEDAPVAQLFASPAHPHTSELLALTRGVHS
jgi:peptide/nickel transport system ATP-binding protein